MTSLRRLWFYLTLRRRLAELDEEMRLHLELRAEAIRRRGVNPDDAAFEAKRRFGGPLKLREESRDMWGFSGVEGIGGDLRYAAHQLLRRPTRTIVVVLTLALGIGANTSIFALLDTLLVRPAPWNHASDLVWIAALAPGSDRLRNISYPDYLEYRDRGTTFASMLATSGNGMSLGGSHPRRVNGGIVSGNYFDVLGVRARLGRTFAPDEDTAPLAHPVTVLSDALWKGQFASDPDVIDRTVTINGTPFTIVGVAPPGFTGIAYADNVEDLWVPLAMQPLVMPASPTLLHDADVAWLGVIARLRDGVTRSQADALVRVVAGDVNRRRRSVAERDGSARVLPVGGGMTPWEQQDFGPIFELLAIVPALVLLVACANVANVLLAGHLSRRKELAMRRAIGASRARLVRLLFLESLLLALVAAFVGFAASFGLTAIIARIGGVPADFAALARPDTRALFMTAAVAIATTLVFGLAPAVMMTKFDVLPAIKDGGPTSTPASGGARLRRVFVVAQVAMSLALLVAAGLFLQSLSKAIRVDPGFDPHGVATVSFDPTAQRYSPARRNAFVAEFAERASALPGVTSAAWTNCLPFSGEAHHTRLEAQSTGRSAWAASADISARYFDTLRLPLISGRDFTEAEAAAGAPVAIVSETLARQLWPSGAVLGQRLRGADGSQPWRDVVGIAREAKYLRLTEAPQGGYYAPGTAQRSGAPLSLVVRTNGDTSTVLRALEGIARGLDADLPLYHVDSLEGDVRQSVNLQRAAAALFGVFGGLALLLASIGIYGVAAQSALVRTREVGIRMAIGARRVDVFRMFVRESVVLSAAGVAAGLVVSAGASVLMTSFLFGLAATDVVTFAAGAAVLGVVTVAATYIPASRAARMDPLVALRHD
jgi:predicted permease